MAQEIINVGAAPNDGQGDPIRTAFIKCNENFTELYTSGNVGNANAIVSGNSIIQIAAVNGNATVAIGGTANIAVFANTGQFITGVVSATGNITANYVLGNGSQLTGITANYSNANVAAFLPTYSGNVTANNFIGAGVGTPTVSSATNLDLSANTAVRVTGGGTFRLPSLDASQIANLTAANGDMIYNTTASKIQGYENGAWGNLI